MFDTEQTRIAKRGLCLGAATALLLALPCAASAAVPDLHTGDWAAMSRTAAAITGDVKVTADSITFGNGDKLALTPAGTVSGAAFGKPDAQAQVFKIANPHDFALLQGNSLCGSAAATYVVALYPSQLGWLDLAFYSGDAAPDEASANGATLCGTYGYGQTPKHVS